MNVLDLNFSAGAPLQSKSLGTSLVGWKKLEYTKGSPADTQRTYKQRKALAQRGIKPKNLLAMR